MHCQCAPAQNHQKYIPVVGQVAFVVFVLGETTHHGDVERVCVSKRVLEITCYRIWASIWWFGLGSEGGVHSRLDAVNKRGQIQTSYQGGQVCGGLYLHSPHLWGGLTRVKMTSELANYGSLILARGGALSLWLVQWSRFCLGLNKITARPCLESRCHALGVTSSEAGVLWGHAQRTWLWGPGHLMSQELFSLSWYIM